MAKLREKETGLHLTQKGVFYRILEQQGRTTLHGLIQDMAAFTGSLGIDTVRCCYLQTGNFTPFFVISSLPFVWEKIAYGRSFLFSSPKTTHI